MEISQSTPSLAGGSGERPIEGRIESIKDGVAQVRISSTQVVPALLESPGANLALGTRVALFQSPDGTFLAKTPGVLADDLKSTTLQILLDSLRSLVGEGAARNLAKPLASGDLEGARKQLSEIWRQLQGQPPEQVAPELRSWLEKQLPALLSRPGEAPVITGAVGLSFGSPTAKPGEYRAQIAGQPATLLGPPDLPAGSKGVWQARQIPGVGAIWAPQASSEPIAPPMVLPQRVAADSQGARQLLAWAGVEATPESARSLGSLLEHVARDFLQSGGHTAEEVDMGALPVSGQDPSASAQAFPSLARTAGFDPAKPSPQPVLQPKPSNPASPGLPQPVAQRVLVAWALDLPDEPLVRKAILADGPGVSQAVEQLATQISSRSGVHPALQAALQEWNQEDWVAPAGLKAKMPANPLRERLAEAVMDALSKTDDTKGQAALRQALQQTAGALIREAIEPPRDDQNREPGAVFQARDAQGRMEEGRIVVHDRRSKKHRTEQPVDHHTVEIEMKPATLGPIKVHLELRGKVLTTRLEAKEAATASLIESRIDELRDAFTRIGLEPAKIDVQRPGPVGRIDPLKRGSGTSLDLRI